MIHTLSECDMSLVEFMEKHKLDPELAAYIGGRVIQMQAHVEGILESTRRAYIEQPVPSTEENAA